MIQSLDTYLYEEIQERLTIILNECYIIDEALRGLDEQAREDFKKTFCGENPKKEIQVSYQFPQTKEAFIARYVISLGSGSEIQKAIGGIHGTYPYREGGHEVEQAEVVRMDDHLLFNTSKPVAEFISCPAVTFAETDNLQIDKLTQRLVFDFANNEQLEGQTFEIHYVSLETDEDVQGTLKGYHASESIGIVGISTNMNTARCLDAILKVILITMRETLQEKNDFMLQQIEFSDMQPVIENGETLVFGRPCVINYQITHTISFDLNTRINEIILKKRGGIH